VCYSRQEGDHPAQGYAIGQEVEGGEGLKGWRSYLNASDFWLGLLSSHYDPRLRQHTLFGSPEGAIIIIITSTTRHLTSLSLNIDRPTDRPAIFIDSSPTQIQLALGASSTDRAIRHCPHPDLEVDLDQVYHPAYTRSEEDITPTLSRSMKSIPKQHHGFKRGRIHAAVGSPRIRSSESLSPLFSLLFIARRFLPPFWWKSVDPRLYLYVL
jgi:hypothetical protein